MAELTPEECEIVAQNPLQDALVPFSNTLRGTFTAPGAPAQYPKLFAKVMGGVFHALCGSTVSSSLASRAGRESLLVDLSLLVSLRQKDRLAIETLVPLSALVRQRAPDVDIWTAVVSVIQSVLCTTPDHSVIPSQDTPLAHTSASQQGSEQTRAKLNRRVCEELCDCTYRNVPGFHRKYFHTKRQRRAASAWQTAKTEYDHGARKWRHLPDLPVQDESWTWWFGLCKLLPQQRLVYLKNCSVGATETNRQLDLMLTTRKTAKEDQIHQWEDVLVLGELKRSPQFSKDLWLQIATAVRHVFAYQPTRRFVHAFSLTATKMENWIFDRSGAYSGSSFDVHAEPEKLVQVLYGYLTMSDEELGIDTYMVKKGSKFVVTVPERGRGGKKQKLDLVLEPIAFQRAIVCRGTACYRSQAGHARFDGVVKFSWTSDLRPAEADLLQKANERGVQGLAKLVGYDNVISIDELRNGLDFTTAQRYQPPPPAPDETDDEPLFPTYSRFQGLTVHSSVSGKRTSSDPDHHRSKRRRLSGSALGQDARQEGATYTVQEPEGASLMPTEPLTYANRILRVLAITPTGQPIGRFKSILQLLESLRDAIKVHRSLLLDGKILHRDISENNILITQPSDGDGFKGMLIDLDLAKEEGQGPSGARHRTGTMEFMAIEVLSKVSHTYRHDLEAFFYVLIWVCVRKSPPTGKQKSLLTRWYTGSYEEIALNKQADMAEGPASGLERILRGFGPAFQRVKPLCRQLRDILFPYRHRGGLFTGTPQDPAVLYTPILGAFDAAISGIEQRRSTRGLF